MSEIKVGDRVRHTGCFKECGVGTVRTVRRLRPSRADQFEVEFPGSGVKFCTLTNLELVGPARAPITLGTSLTLSQGTITLASPLGDVWAELERADVHGPFASAHEGYAVILEEMDELKEHVWTKHKNRDLVEMRKEAVQVAAMACKFIQMIDEGKGTVMDITILAHGCTLYFGAHVDIAMVYLKALAGVITPDNFVTASTALDPSSADQAQQVAQNCLDTVL